MPFQNKSARPAKFITPPNKLKAKAGTGGISKVLIERAQDYINNNNIDFTPFAHDYLKQLMDRANAAKTARAQYDREALIDPIMQLKANGGMFQYQLVSEVADICLQFLECIEDFDNDVYTIIAAHENTIKVILKNKLTGDGGKEGYILVKELQKACERYFSKHQNT